jgi:hypothetical protein
MERENWTEKEKRIRFRDLIKFPSTTYATFGLYRYPAKFIPQVIAYVLEKYANPGMEIFDPFAGYGTVGIVSRIYNCNYELWDLNPLLEIFHRIATMEPKEIDLGKILHKMASCKEEFIPQWSRLNYWFHAEFLPFLFNVWGFYHSLDDAYIKLLLTIPLLKTSRYFSYDDLQRQKLSKSPKSKKRIESLLKRDWKVEFLRIVEEETRRIIKRLREYQMISPKQTNAIVKGGVDTLSMRLEEEKDILITSPPYLQSHEYIRQAKMDLFWLGYSENYIKKLARLEIPYREVKPITIYSEIYSQYRDRVKEPYRKIYDRYFWGVLGALTCLQQNIRSYLFLFIGRPSIRGCQIPIDRIFAEHFSAMGWAHKATLIDTIIARQLFSYRINPATGINDKRTKTENLVILQKKS